MQSKTYWQKEGIHMLYPKRLIQGDTIGIIAPASPPNMDKLQKAIPFFERQGLHVLLGEYIDSQKGYLAGSDEERLADFNQMIANQKVKGIFFARGGYGTGRIVSQIDYELIKSNPKIIWGYSDITYLHTAIRQETNLVTFHGPMAASDVGDETFDQLSAALFNQLFEPTVLCYKEPISELNVLVHGQATGKLVGGNLSLLCSTLGTPYEIDTKDKLLFFEDIGEAPYRIDSMLNQLNYAGKLADAAGIVVGDFKDCDPKGKPSLHLDEVFEHYLARLTCPVMTGFKIGHCFPHFSIPLGSEATLDTAAKALTILPGVR